MTQMSEVTLTIVNELGLHARAATLFVQTASQYEADVFVSKDGQEVNGKSILGILTLIAIKDSQIAIRAEGPGAEQAIEALEQLVAQRFGEER